MMFPSRLVEAFCLLALIVQFAGPAPVQDFPIRLGRIPRMQGCYFKADHFENGEKILTQEPCLNCTCIDSTVMCYLRVCPFVKPLGEDCVEVKNEDDCCPTFKCPEVAKEKDCHDSNYNPDQPGCFLNGTYYSDGSMLPQDPKKPCEVCYCIRNSTSCVVQECELKIEGCSPMYKSGQCCPCRYNCSYDGIDLTTIPPGYDAEVLSDGCVLSDRQFIPDGEAVNSTNPCEHCYCMRNEVVCAIQECQAPGDNCKPLPIKQGQCCPDQYDCPISNSSSDSSISSSSQILTTDKVTLPKISKEASAISPEEVDLSSVDSNIFKEKVHVVKSDETEELDYKITPEEVSEEDKVNLESPEPNALVKNISKNYQLITEAAQPNILSEDISRDVEKVTEISHPEDLFDDISVDSKVAEEEIKPFVTVENTSKDYESTAEITFKESYQDIPKDNEAAAELASTNIHLKDTPKDETVSSDKPEPTISSKSTAFSDKDIGFTHSSNTDFSSSSTSFTHIIDSVNTKLLPESKTGSNRDKFIEPNKFGQKGGFEEIPYYKATPPPMKSTTSFSKNETLFKDTATYFSTPPLTRFPYKLPPSILRIKGQNTTYVISPVTGKYEPSRSQGIKGGIITISVPSTTNQGIKGGFQGAKPNRHRPILPVGAIPGEKKQGLPVKLPGMGTIPGEDICLVGKIAYRNGHQVPSNDVCKFNCHCIEGVVYCDKVVCGPPPEDSRNCVQELLANECCPRYHCYSTSTTPGQVSVKEMEVSKDASNTPATLLEVTVSENPKLVSEVSLIEHKNDSDAMKNTETYPGTASSVVSTEGTDTTKEILRTDISLASQDSITKEHTQSTTDIPEITTLSEKEYNSSKDATISLTSTTPTEKNQITEKQTESPIINEEKTTQLYDNETVYKPESADFDKDAFTNETIIDHLNEEQLKMFTTTSKPTTETTKFLEDELRNHTDMTSTFSTVASFVPLENITEENVSATNTLLSEKQFTDDEAKTTQAYFEGETLHFDQKDFTTQSELQTFYSQKDHTIFDKTPVPVSDTFEYFGNNTEVLQESSTLTTAPPKITTLLPEKFDGDKDYTASELSSTSSLDTIKYTESSIEISEEPSSISTASHETTLHEKYDIHEKFTISNTATIPSSDAFEYTGNNTEPTKESSLSSTILPEITTLLLVKEMSKDTPLIHTILSEKPIESVELPVTSSEYLEETVTPHVFKTGFSQEPSSTIFEISLPEELHAEEISEHTTASETYLIDEDKKYFHSKTPFVPVTTLLTETKGISEQATPPEIALTDVDKKYFNSEAPSVPLTTLVTEITKLSFDPTPLNLEKDEIHFDNTTSTVLSPVVEYGDSKKTSEDEDIETTTELLTSDKITRENTEISEANKTEEVTMANVPHMQSTSTPPEDHEETSSHSSTFGKEKEFLEGSLKSTNATEISLTEAELLKDPSTNPIYDSEITTFFPDMTSSIEKNKMTNNTSSELMENHSELSDSTLDLLSPGKIKYVEDNSTNINKKFEEVDTDASSEDLSIITANEEKSATSISNVNKDVNLTIQSSVPNTSPTSTEYFEISTSQITSVEDKKDKYPANISDSDESVTFSTVVTVPVSKDELPTIFPNSNKITQESTHAHEEYINDSDKKEESSFASSTLTVQSSEILPIYTTSKDNSRISYDEHADDSDDMIVNSKLSTSSIFTQEPSGSFPITTEKTQNSTFVYQEDISGFQEIASAVVSPNSSIDKAELPEKSQTFTTTEDNRTNSHEERVSMSTDTTLHPSVSNTSTFEKISPEHFQTSTEVAEKSTSLYQEDESSRDKIESTSIAPSTLSDKTEILEKFPISITSEDYTKISYQQDIGDSVNKIANSTISSLSTFTEESPESFSISTETSTFLSHEDVSEIDEIVSATIAPSTSMNIGEFVEKSQHSTTSEDERRTFYEEDVMNSNVTIVHEIVSNISMFKEKPSESFQTTTAVSQGSTFSYQQDSGDLDELETTSDALSTSTDKDIVSEKIPIFIGSENNTDHTIAHSAVSSSSTFTEESFESLPNSTETAQKGVSGSDEVVTASVAPSTLVEFGEFSEKSQISTVNEDGTRTFNEEDVSDSDIKNVQPIVSSTTTFKEESSKSSQTSTEVPQESTTLNQEYISVLDKSESTLNALSTSTYKEEISEKLLTTITSEDYTKSSYQEDISDSYDTIVSSTVHTVDEHFINDPTPTKIAQGSTYLDQKDEHDIDDLISPASTPSALATEVEFSENFKFSISTISKNDTNVLNVENISDIDDMLTFSTVVGTSATGIESFEDSTKLDDKITNAQLQNVSDIYVRTLFSTVSSVTMPEDPTVTSTTLLYTQTANIIPSENEPMDLHLERNFSNTVEHDQYSTEMFKSTTITKQNSTDFQSLTTLPDLEVKRIFNQTLNATAPQQDEFDNSTSLNINVFSAIPDENLMETKTPFYNASERIPSTILHSDLEITSSEKTPESLLFTTESGKDDSTNFEGEGMKDYEITLLPFNDTIYTGISEKSPSKVSETATIIPFSYPSTNKIITVFDQEDLSNSSDTKQPLTLSIETTKYYTAVSKPLEFEQEMSTLPTTTYNDTGIIILKDIKNKEISANENLNFTDSVSKSTLSTSEETPPQPSEYLKDTEISQESSSKNIPSTTSTDDLIVTSSQVLSNNLSITHVVSEDDLAVLQDSDIKDSYSESDMHKESAIVTTDLPLLDLATTMSSKIQPAELDSLTTLGDFGTKELYGETATATYFTTDELQKTSDLAFIDETLDIVPEKTEHSEGIKNLTEITKLETPDTESINSLSNNTEKTDFVSPSTSTIASGIDFFESSPTQETYITENMKKPIVKETEKYSSPSLSTTQFPQTETEHSVWLTSERVSINKSATHVEEKEQNISDNNTILPFTITEISIANITEKNDQPQTETSRYIEEFISSSDKEQDFQSTTDFKNSETNDETFIYEENLSNSTVTEFEKSINSFAHEKETTTDKAEVLSSTEKLKEVASSFSHEDNTTDLYETTRTSHLHDVTTSSLNVKPTVLSFDILDGTEIPIGNKTENFHQVTFSETTAEKNPEKASITSLVVADKTTVLLNRNDSTASYLSVTSDFDSSHGYPGTKLITDTTETILPVKTLEASTTESTDSEPYSDLDFSTKVPRDSFETLKHEEDISKLSTDAIYEEAFTKKMTTIAGEQEMATSDVTTTPSIVAIESTTPDPSLEDEKTDIPSSFMTIAPENLLFTASIITENPKIMETMEDNYHPEKESFLSEEVSTTLSDNLENEESKQDINAQESEKQQTLTLPIIKEAEKGTMLKDQYTSLTDKNIFHTSYTTTPFNINENITFSLLQKDFTEISSQIVGSKDVFHADDWFHLSENISDVTTQMTDEISKDHTFFDKPFHLSESALEKDSTVTNADVSYHSSVAATEKDSAASTEKTPEIYDSKRKYPLLVSEVIYQYESNETKDQSLIGHKIKESEIGIVSALEHVDHGTSVEEISQVNKISTVPQESENINQAHDADSTQTKSEQQGTLSSISSDVSQHQFTNTSSESEKPTETPLEAEEADTTVHTSPFYEFSTQQDTIIERETLPQATMQSPESLISHSEILSESFSTTISPQREKNITISADKEIDVTSHWTGDQDLQTTQTTVQEAVSILPENLEHHKQMALPTISSNKELENATYTSSFELETKPQVVEIILNETTVKSPISAIELTEEIDFPRSVVTGMPTKFKTKIPEPAKENTFNVVIKEFSISTLPPTEKETSRHDLQTVDITTFESIETKPIKDNYETTAKTVQYPEFTVEKSNTSAENQKTDNMPEPNMFDIVTEKFPSSTSLPSEIQSSQHYLKTTEISVSSTEHFNSSEPMDSSLIEELSESVTENETYKPYTAENVTLEAINVTLHTIPDTMPTSIEHSTLQGAFDKMDNYSGFSNDSNSIYSTEDNTFGTTTTTKDSDYTLKTTENVPFTTFDDTMQTITTINPQDLAVKYITTTVDYLASHSEKSIISTTQLPKSATEISDIEEDKGNTELTTEKTENISSTHMDSSSTAESGEIKFESNNTFNLPKDIESDDKTITDLFTSTKGWMILNDTHTKLDTVTSTIFINISESTVIPPITDEAHTRPSTLIQTDFSDSTEMAFTVTSQMFDDKFNIIQTNGSDYSTLTLLPEDKSTTLSSALSNVDDKETTTFSTHYSTITLPPSTDKILSLLLNDSYSQDVKNISSNNIYKEENLTSFAESLSDLHSTDVKTVTNSHISENNQTTLNLDQDMHFTPDSSLTGEIQNTAVPENDTLLGQLFGESHISSHNFTQPDVESDTHPEKWNHPTPSSFAGGWEAHTLQEDIIKALSTVFPSSHSTLVYETHAQFPTGTTINGHQDDESSGVCYFEGKVYLSSEQIQRADTCEFCFCFKGDIICLQQTCPPPIKGCYAIPIDGFCCPRFHCPVQQMWFGVVPPTTTTTLQPMGKTSHGKQYPTPGCQVEGKSYRLHQIIHRASSACMLCRCDYGGIMKCEPRSCKPEPPMIQEIAEAFSRRRRRRRQLP